MELNEEQKIAVAFRDGQCFLAACPGSGKTAVLCERAVYLIKSGINPKHIACITFTNKAAKEMKERITKMLGDSVIMPYVGTFHAFCVQVLRSFGHYIGYLSSFSIADQTDQCDLILQIGRKEQLKLEKSDIYKIANAVNACRESIKNDDASIEEHLEDKKFLSPIVKKYLKYIKSKNIIDFSGLLSETHRLFVEQPKVLKQVQGVIRHLSLDEAQDTNLIQFVIAEMITEEHKNFFCVFDTDQSIYQWRGARPQNIQDYLDRHPGCKVLNLSLNYRSTPEIVKSAENLIKHNRDRFLEKFQTVNPSGNKPICVAHNSQFDEAEWTADYISKLINSGSEPNEIAVLYRVNAISEMIERALVSKGIQYIVIGSRSFYDRKEIKDVLAMLKFIANPKDGIAFHRICSIVSGVGDTTVAQIEDMSEGNDVTILDACKNVLGNARSARIKEGIQKVISVFDQKYDNMPVADIANKVIADVEYEPFILNFDAENGEDRMENIRQLIDSAAHFGKHETLAKYLQQISLFTAVDKNDEKGKVSLMTCHASKGTEYKNVLVISLEEGSLPHYITLKEDPDGETSERRLMYVAMTRCKEQLVLSYSKMRKSYNRIKQVRPSRFLKEAGLLK